MESLQKNYLDRPISELPAVLADTAKAGYQKVSDWTAVAKDWAGAHKKEILVALAVAGVALFLLGLSLMATGAASGLFTTTETFTHIWNYGNFKTVTQIGVQVSEKFIAGLALAIGGALGANAAWKAKAV